jgi:hypothetical protein
MADSGSWHHRGPQEGIPIPVSVVMLVNLCDVEGANLSRLWDNPSVKKRACSSLEALLNEWETASLRFTLRLTH